MKKNKRIGIITLQGGNNYGAMFQIYALTKYLESLNHDVFVVNYHYKMDKANIIDYLKHPLAFTQKLLNKNALSINFLKQKQLGSDEKLQEHRFDTIFNDFRKKHLNIDGALSNNQELANNCPKADIFICGSDQVWADDFLFSSPAFLIGFAPDSAKKVSYAASFGKDKLEPYLHKIFTKHLKKFHAISVREQSGLSIIKNIAGLEASHVLDPTLLLDDYSALIDYSLVPEGSYTLTYRLSQNYELACWMTEATRNISKNMNHSVLSITTNCPWDINIGDQELHPTPGQLLGLIEKSSLFITNSFHGTVFSIILKAKFLTFARDIFKDKQNIRMTDLLTSLNIDHLYCPPFAKTDDLYKKIEHKYDYTNVYKALEKPRMSSKEFLAGALG